MFEPQNIVSLSTIDLCRFTKFNIFYNSATLTKKDVYSKLKINFPFEPLIFKKLKTALFMIYDALINTPS